MIHRVVGSQNVSRMCIVCGVENDAGLKASFYALENGDLAGVFQPKEEHQGYPGRLHGGMISAMLDETIGRAVNIDEPETWCVTVELNVKFRRPVPTDGDVKVVGRVTENLGRAFEGTGEIVLEDGTVAAEGWGRYLRMPIKDIAHSHFAESEWMEDGRPLPAEIEI